MAGQKPSSFLLGGCENSNSTSKRAACGGNHPLTSNTLILRAGGAMRCYLTRQKPNLSHPCVCCVRSSTLVFLHASIQNHNKGLLHQALVSYTTILYTLKHADLGLKA